MGLERPSKGMCSFLFLQTSELSILKGHQWRNFAALGTVRAMMEMAQAAMM